MAEYQDYGYVHNGPGHTFNYLQRPLLSLLDKNHNRCILDVGCGNGHLANYLLSKGFNVYGTDASNEGISIARQINYDRFFVQDLSTDELPVGLKDLKFDTIIATEVIEHLYNPAAFVMFCKKTLVTNGELIISTPYHGYLKNLLISLFNNWDNHIDPLWLGGHIKLWSAKTLSRLLAGAGFKVTAFKGCGRVPYLWMSMVVKAKLLTE